MFDGKTNAERVQTDLHSEPQEGDPLQSGVHRNVCIASGLPVEPRLNQQFGWKTQAESRDD